MRRILVILYFFLAGCQSITRNDAHYIYEQLPDHQRPALVPQEFKEVLEFENLISLDEIEKRQTTQNKTFSEKEFYTEVRKLGIQYIVIPSKLINSGSEVFPWIHKKNFKVCPGNPDSEFDRYYTLLVWDNTNHTYMFFRYLYVE